MRSLQPPVGLTYTTGAAVLMAELADQTSLPWPDDLPRKIKREKEVDPTKATVVGLSDSN